MKIVFNRKAMPKKCPVLYSQLSVFLRLHFSGSRTFTAGDLFFWILKSETETLNIKLSSHVILTAFYGAILTFKCTTGFKCPNAMWCVFPSIKFTRWSERLLIESFSESRGCGSGHKQKQNMRCRTYLVRRIRRLNDDWLWVITQLSDQTSDYYYIESVSW